MKYELKLEFEQGEEESLEKINKLLEALPLTSCELQDPDCRTFKRTTYENGVEQSVTYGLDIESVTLVCEQNEDEEEGVFQIDTAVFPAEESFEPQKFMQNWKNANPGRTFEGMTALRYASSTTAVLVKFRQ